MVEVGKNGQRLTTIRLDTYPDKQSFSRSATCQSYGLVAGEISRIVRFVKKKTGLHKKVFKDFHRQHAFFYKNLVYKNLAWFLSQKLRTSSSPFLKEKFKIFLMESSNVEKICSTTILQKNFKYIFYILIYSNIF